MGGIRGGRRRENPCAQNAIAAGRAFCRIHLSRNFLHLEAFFAGLAKFDLTNPLRLENLSSCKTTRRMGVQHGVDDISATSLWNRLIQIQGESRKGKTINVTIPYAMTRWGHSPLRRGDPPGNERKIRPRPSWRDARGVFRCAWPCK